MDSRKHDMQIMHSMCERELHRLQINLNDFVQESEHVEKTLREINCTGGNGSYNNIFGLIAFDSYMSQVHTVLNMAIKFNMHLQRNKLHQKVINSSQSRLLQEFLVFSNTIPKNCMLLNSETNETIGTLIKDEGFTCKTSRYSAAGSEITAFISRMDKENSFPPLSSTYSDFDQNNNSNLKQSCAEINDLVKYEIEIEGECVRKISTDTLRQMENLLKMLLPTKSLDHFKTGYEFCAYIVNVHNYKEFEFFICETSDCKILYEISCNLNCTPIPPSCLTNDIFCLLHKKSNTVRECMWRAVMVPNNKHNSQDLVYLLDFGKIIPLTDMCSTCKAPLDYRQIHPIAIKCILKGVQDSSNCIINDQDKCERALHTNEYEKVNFRVIQQKDGVLYVILLEKPQRDGKILKETTGNPFKNFQILEDEEKNSEEKDNLQLPMSVVYSPVSTDQPSLNICPYIGKIIPIIVTYVVSPISFYAIIQNSFCANSKILAWHDLQITASQKQIAPPQINDIVLSQYVKDGYWYRAKIINVDTAEDLYKVFYVDFGNTEVVPLCCLATCTKEQMEDPLRAVLFHLANLSIVTIDDNSDVNTLHHMETLLKKAKENLVIMILDQMLNVEVVGRRKDDLVVRLVDDQYADIQKMFISMGIIKEV